MNIFAFLKKHSLAVFFLLAFAISWGGFVLAIGPAGLKTSDWQNSPLFGLAVMAMLAGPCTAGLLMIGLTEGKSGLRKLLSGLLKWRVHPKWYAWAILPAPLLSVFVLFVLSIKSPIFTADDKIGVLVSGVLAGLTIVLEEVGWTGFAVPRLRRRYGLMVTGLIVGGIWGLWHLLQQIFISGTYTGDVPPVLYLTLALFSTVAGLTAYRILLVWIFDRTASLLVTTLMHASLTASNIFIFRPEATGMTFLIFGLAFTAVQWLLVAAVFMADRRRFAS